MSTACLGDLCVDESIEAEQQPGRSVIAESWRNARAIDPTNSLKSRVDLALSSPHAQAHNNSLRVAERRWQIFPPSDWSWYDARNSMPEGW
jgi:hypothetical protein